LSWQWDETLFAGAAPYYEQGRLPYAPGLAEALAAALGLDGHGRLLDVGCGPGTVTLPLAHLFQEAVGLDADSDMLVEASRLAVERGVSNVRWVNRRAEELPAGLGKFRVIAFAASFHWMERPKVAAAAFKMLEPGGAVVHVDNHHQDGFDNTALPHPPLPAQAIIDLNRSYLGPERRAGRSVIAHTPSGEDDVFRAAGFEGPEGVRVADGRVLERTIDQVVAGEFSASYSAPLLFGPRLADFEAELRRLLAQLSPSGLFSVRLPDNELKIWRPRTGAGYGRRSRS
jgi:trans-aconitate methyltransferase